MGAVRMCCAWCGAARCPCAGEERDREQAGRAGAAGRTRSWSLIERTVRRAVAAAAGGIQMFRVQARALADPLEGERSGEVAARTFAPRRAAVVGAGSRSPRTARGCTTSAPLRARAPDEQELSARRTGSEPERSPRTLARTARPRDGTAAIARTIDRTLGTMKKKEKARRRLEGYEGEGSSAKRKAKNEECEGGLARRTLRKRGRVRNVK